MIYFIISWLCVTELHEFFFFYSSKPARQSRSVGQANVNLVKAAALVQSLLKHLQEEEEKEVVFQKMAVVLMEDLHELWPEMFWTCRVCGSRTCWPCIGKCPLALRHLLSGINWPCLDVQGNQSGVRNRRQTLMREFDKKTNALQNHEMTKYIMKMMYLYL